MRFFDRMRIFRLFVCELHTFCSWTTHTIIGSFLWQFSIECRVMLVKWDATMSRCRESRKQEKSCSMNKPFKPSNCRTNQGPTRERRIYIHIKSPWICARNSYLRQPLYLQLHLSHRYICVYGSSANKRIKQQQCNTFSRVSVSKITFFVWIIAHANAMQPMRINWDCIIIQWKQ